MPNSARVTALLSVMIGLLLILPVAAQQPVVDNLQFSITCDGFSFQGGSVTLTRDNTGNGREQFSIGAIDGAGNIVFTPVVDSALVGTRLDFTTQGSYRWLAPPSANPITISVVSLSGNSATQQILYTQSGNCSGLPVGTVSGVVVPSGSPGSLTSPSVPIGAPVPVPTSDTERIEQLLGYAIVNTSFLNLRTGDGPEYTKVAVVRGATRAVVLGRNREFSWWLLEVGGIRGWANAEFLILRGDLTDVPVLEAQGELQPFTALTFLPQPIFREKSNLNRDFICNVVPGEHTLRARSAPDSPNYYLIQAPCEDGRIAIGWIGSDRLVIRNPAGQAVPVQ